MLDWLAWARWGLRLRRDCWNAAHEVIVWNRSPDKAQAIGGCRRRGCRIARPTLAAQSEAIATILTDAAAVDAVYHGPSGLLSGDVAGKLFIEMSTVQPQTEIVLAEKVRAKSAAFVECPVGGTTGPARQGKLFGFAGGTTADFERAKPLLDQMCRRVEHCGDVGSGSGMKLAINLPLMIYWQALGEALADQPPSQHRAVTHDGYHRRYIWRIDGGEESRPEYCRLAWWRRFRCGDVQSRRCPQGYPHHDRGEARRAGVDLPLIEKTLACFDEASAAGFGQGDGSGQAVYWSRRKKS